MLAFRFLSLRVALIAAACAGPLWAQPAAPVAPETPAAAPEAAPATPSPLSESLTGVAKADYEAGKLLYQDGDYAGAQLKFRAAYDSAKDPRLLWNTAAAEKNLRRYAQVQILIERYLAEGGALLSEQDRADAEALLVAVRPFVGSLKISVEPTGAAIAVDDQPVGTAPLPEPLRLDMGPRRIKVSLTGYEDFATVEQVRGGMAHELTVQLREAKHEGRLRVVADDRTASISVDGKPVGTGQWEGRLPSGQHTVQVTARGKRPYRTEVLVQDDQLNSFSVTLEKEDSGGVAPWMWVAGGAVLAAGIGVGGYFLLRPDSESGTAAPVLGTMAPGFIQLP